MFFTDLGPLPATSVCLDRERKVFAPSTTDVRRNLLTVFLLNILLARFTAMLTVGTFFTLFAGCGCAYLKFFSIGCTFRLSTGAKLFTDNSCLAGCDFCAELFVVARFEFNNNEWVNYF